MSQKRCAWGWKWVKFGSNRAIIITMQPGKMADKIQYGRYIENDAKTSQIRSKPLLSPIFIRTVQTDFMLLQLPCR